MANSSAQQSDFGIKRPVPIVLKKVGERGMPAGWYAYGLTVDDVEVPAQVLPAYGGPFGSKTEVEQAISAHWGPKSKRNPPARRRKKNPSWLLPVAIAGGVIVVGTAAALAIRRYRKINALEPGTPNEPIVEPPSDAWSEKVNIEAAMPTASDFPMGWSPTMEPGGIGADAYVLQYRILTLNTPADNGVEYVLVMSGANKWGEFVHGWSSHSTRTDLARELEDAKATIVSP